VNATSNVTPFQLLKRSSAQALAERCGAALARWGAAWPPLPDQAVSCSAASEHAAVLSGELRRRTLADGTPVWALVPAASARYLEQLVFGLHEMDAMSDKHLPSPLGASVADDALEDLLQQLVHGATGQASQAQEPGAPPAQLLRRGSGAVLCTVQLGERAIRVLLPAAALPPLGASPRRASGTALVALHQALAHLPVTLSVEVSRTELTLGYLRTLAVGDVLALPTGVDHALRVVGPGETTVCHAHLGALSGHRAVEMIKQQR
jgi:flagellar motor switch/type III secretory pathway protein FliN